MTSLFRLCYAFPLLAAGAVSVMPCTAVAEPAAVQTSAMQGRTLFCYNEGDMNKAGDSLRLVFFGEPMVADSQVGQEARLEDYLTIEGLAKPELKAEWIATGEMKITLLQDFSQRGQVATLRVKPGLAAPSGKELRTNFRVIGNRGAVSFESSHWSFGTDVDYALITPDEDSESSRHALETAMKSAYYRAHVDGTSREQDTKVPAVVRPATVADALADWVGFQRICGLAAEDSDRKLLAARSPEEVLPGVWRVEAPVLPTAEHEMTLVLPGLGAYDASTQTYKESSLGTTRLYAMNGSLTNEHVGFGRYRLKVAVNQAMSADVEKLFRESAWQVAEGKEFAPMEWDEARKAFVGKVKDGEVVLTLDEGASLAHAKEYNLIGGGKALGTNQLVLQAQTPGAPVRVRAVSPFVSLYGRSTGGPEVATDAALHRDYCTRLAPATPYLYTNMTSCGLRGEGKRAVHCRAGHLDKLQARVYRIEAAGADTPQLLLNYAKNYKDGYKSDRYGNSFLEKVEWDEKQPDWKGSVGLPQHLIPAGAQMACTELELDDEGEATLDPTSLFPDKDPHATYFVQLEGTPNADWTEHKGVYNQGVVQVTDLGLMWKLSAGQVFAYAYRLSDGKPLPGGTLRLLDKDGKTLAELPVGEGIATCPYVEGVRFLQLQQGADCYTTRAADHDDRAYAGCEFDEHALAYKGIDVSTLPFLQHCVFSDRKLYRNGETARIKGILRFLQGNSLSVPPVEGVTATVRFDDTTAEFPVHVEGDGTFSLDLPIAPGWYGYGTVRFNITYKGDADKSTADCKAMAATGLDADEYLYKSYLENNRCVEMELVVQDFRRNEFEVGSSLEPAADGRHVKVTAEARNFSGAPVSKGRVEWTVDAKRINFYPGKFSDYRFGTSEGNDFFDFYYYGRSVSQESEYTIRTGELDDEGKAAAEVELPAFRVPGRCRVVVSASVTNGNEQTLRSVRSCTLESSGVYAGLRSAGRLAKLGEPMELDAILVTPEGEAYAGEPLPATLRVKRTSFHSYRYGSHLLSSIRNEKKEVEYPEQAISLGGKPVKLQIPTDRAGIYDIVVEGKDAQGKPYHTSLRRYVWGGDVSPWEYGMGEDLALTADKDTYKPGETAHILVQVPVDSEVLFTVEREGVHRTYRRTVTVADPVAEIPLEPGDAPVVRVGAYVVQGATERPKKGLPLIKRGEVELHVDDPAKHLTLQLETPGKPVVPTEDCTLAGVVMDAGGKPVANAEIALYAEDEGTLQVMGYEVPNPYAAFYGKRPMGVYTFGTDGQLLGDMANDYDYGNKGVFIGGGDEMEDEGNGLDPTAERGPRKDFNPCALWLAHVRTDANGRFTATYRNPDTMTRYRVMAVASAGADKFGKGVAAYRVAQPVMLEPSAPLHATEGDRLDVPVTLTMLSELLPAGTNGQVEWKVALQGANATVDPATQNVTLQADRPATVSFPVTVGGTGTTTLTWSVATTQPGMENTKDAVQLSFEVVPTTPHLRLPMLGELGKGKKLNPATLLSEKLRADADAALTVSVSPLTGVCAGVDYLFRYPYGCTEQLCSTMVPWLLQETLVKWADAEFPANRTADEVVAKTLRTLLDTRRNDDGSYSYWGKDDNSEFTPYVAYVLTYCQGDADKYLTLLYLRRELMENPDGNLLALMVLARERPAATKELLPMLNEKRKKWRLIDRWMELCAELDILAWADKVEPAELARVTRMLDAARTATRKAKPEERSSAGYAEPPFEAVMQIANIRLAALKGNVAERLDYVRDYAERVVRGQSSPLSTREMAWCCIMLDEFCRAYEKERRVSTAKVNGTEISLGNPLRIKDKLGNLPVLTWQGGGKAYVSGLTTGYTVAPQGKGGVDKGFLVSRRYEKLMPDGSWKPVGEFSVGDVVRVTFTAKGTKPNSGHYLMAEDRLPAGFEAVNPMLTSQALPEGVSADDGNCWWTPGWVDHVEYHKDRVLFAASSFAREAELEARYVVRVVKSGTMTAPAAKVEMMYAPGIYGLSIPQEFKVAPRQD